MLPAKQAREQYIQNQGDEQIQNLVECNGFNQDTVISAPEQQLVHSADYFNVLSDDRYKDIIQKERQLKLLLIENLNIQFDYEHKSKDTTEGTSSAVKKSKNGAETVCAKDETQRTPSAHSDDEDADGEKSLTVNDMASFLNEYGETHFFDEDGKVKNNQFAVYLMTFYELRMDELIKANPTLFGDDEMRIRKSISMYVNFIVLLVTNREESCGFLTSFQINTDSTLPVVRAFLQAKRQQQSQQNDTASKNINQTKPAYKKYKKLFNIGRNYLSKSIKPYIFAISEVASFEPRSFKASGKEEARQTIEGYEVKFNNMILVRVVKSNMKTKNKMHELSDLKPLVEILRILLKEEVYDTVVQRCQQDLKMVDIGSSNKPESEFKEQDSSIECLGYISGLDIIPKEAWSIARFLEEKAFFYDGAILDIVKK